MFFLKKSGIFWSIIILESPQLGIVKMKIKIIICKIVLKRPKKNPFARDSFFIRNEGARWWILYLIFTWITITNWILMFLALILCVEKVFKITAQMIKNSDIIFPYCFPLEELLNRNFLYFQLDSLLFGLNVFSFWWYWHSLNPFFFFEYAGP